MTTTVPVLKLTKGTRILNLNSGRYQIGLNFVPPATSVTSQYSGNISANRTGGASLVGQRATNRSFSFDLKIVGSSETEVRRAIQDVDLFLSWAGDESEPLYLEYKPNSDTPEPLWGNYGTNLRYEIVDGNISPDALYMTTDLRGSTLPKCRISLTIKPFALGKKQRLATALGGIAEDIYGAEDKISHGLVVPEATTNLMTNPVFGNADWDNGWAVTASMTASQNTDKNYILFGSSSAKLSGNGAAPVFYQAINAGTTSAIALSCYAKFQDGGTLSSSQCQLYYNTGGITTTFTNIGNGWYHLGGTVAGVGSAVAAGFYLVNGYTAYIDGFQLEIKSYPTVFAYGDMLGCAWTGAAHASTSTRSLGEVGITINDDVFTKSSGAVRAIWRADKASASFGIPDKYVWSSYGGTSELTGKLKGGTQFVYSSDGVNLAASSEQSFSSGDAFILHYTWGTNGLKQYINGTVNGTATFTRGTVADTWVFIGNYAGAGQINGTFMDFATFDTELTATQVANDYANIAPLIADDQRVGCIPYLWTKDGDDVVDNCDDATHDNYCVIHGIPGNEDAKTDILATTSTNFSVTPSLVLSNAKVDDFIAPTSLLYFDLGGSADANSSGTAYCMTSVDATETNISGGAGVDCENLVKYLAGETCYGFTRLSDAGSTLTTKVQLDVGRGISSTYKSMAGTSFYLFSSNDIAIPTKTMTMIDGDDITGLSGAVFSMWGKRTSGTANVSVDYCALLPSPTVLTLSASGVQFLYSGGKVVLTDSAGKTAEVGITAGNILELSPDKYNILMSFIGDATHAPTITNTITYNAIKVTPRWSLL